LSLSERPNLADLACKYLKYLTLQRTASEHTSKSYANDLSQFLAPLGVQKILYTSADPGPSFQISWKKTQVLSGDLNKQNVTLVREVQDRWATLSAASRNRKLAVLRGFLRWLFEHRHVPEDLSLRLIAPKVPQKLPHFLSVDEALALLKSPADREVRALLMLLYGGGLRVSEACQLQWRDLVTDARSIRVLGKGGKTRIVSLPRLCWESLTSLPKTGNYVFGCVPLSTRRAYDWVRKAGAKAGLLKPLHPHALRHSYATHLLTSGTNLRVLQELLGHSSLAATQKYTHLHLDHLARVLENHHPLSASKVKKGRLIE
jgi:site-specific recombinase XerD